MPSKVDPNITPRPEDYAALRKDGIPPEFVDWEIKNFIEYWVERGENGDKEARKKAWFTALRRWMRTGFQGKAGAEFERIKDQLCSNRNGGLKTDLFEGVLTQAEHDHAVKRQSQRQGNPSTAGGTEYRHIQNAYRIIEHNKPEQGPPMKPEDAFNQLRQEGHIK